MGSTSEEDNNIDKHKEIYEEIKNKDTSKIPKSRLKTNHIGQVEQLIPKQKKMLNTNRKRNLMILQFVWFPIALVTGGVPYVPTPMGLPEFTPAITTILQIITLIIGMSTGFTSVAFYNEKRLTNKISEAVQTQAIEMNHVNKSLERLRGDFDDKMDLKIENFEKRLGTIESIFWNKKGSGG